MIDKEINRRGVVVEMLKKEFDIKHTDGNRSKVHAVKAYKERVGCDLSTAIKAWKQAEEKWGDKNVE
jgi:hypothetical protein